MLAHDAPDGGSIAHVGYLYAACRRGAIGCRPRVYVKLYHGIGTMLAAQLPDEVAADLAPGSSD
jgi:hypothetical protein